MFIVVLLFPLITTLLLVLFGSSIGVYGSLIISCGNLFFAFGLSFFLFFYSSFDKIFLSSLWDWLAIDSFFIDFTFRYDSLTAAMFVVVTTISLMVHLYSSVYMYNDPFLTRFMSYLSLFTFFMLVLVSAGNLLVLFVGWEGVGLCSYLLIGFWHTRVQAGKSATKAFLINKIGDLFLLSGISLTFAIFHSVDFSVLSVLAPFISSEILELLTIFLFFGAVGKSAQVGLHTWLPDAMEGPTPVSALIHAATMVTAGVFLLVRFSFILEYSPRILFIIAIWGGVTALISGTIGSVQNDIKKIIAYSTCSQLGYMTLACGLSLFNVGFFHLFNHAFFKALLFLSAGSIIHFLGNEQDIRRMGGLARLGPFIYINVFIASLALVGFPFLSGFYSKDIIIEVANSKFWVSGQLLYWFASVSALLTMFYSIRLLYIVFLSPFGGFKIVIKNHAKTTTLEIIILGFLGAGSLIIGFVTKDLFLGLGSNYFSSSISQSPSSWSFLSTEFIPAIVKMVPTLTSLIAFFVAVKLTQSHTLIFIFHSKTYFEMSKWFYNELLNHYFALPSLCYARHSFEQIEKRNLELNGPLLFCEKILTLYSPNLLRNWK